MEQFITPVTNFISITMAIAALVLSWRAYNRENTINSENFIYQKKFNSNRLLFSLAVELLDCAETIVALIKTLPKDKTQHTEEELEKEMDDFDSIEERLELELMKQSPLISEMLVDKYWAFIYNKSPYEDVYELKNWEAQVDHYYDLLDEIHIVLSNELHLQELGKKILIRIGKSRSLKNELNRKRKK